MTETTHTDGASTALAVAARDPISRADALSEAVSLVRRMDGWTSNVTGIGIALRDKSYDARFAPALYLSDQELEDLCDGNGMAARICEIVGDAAVQKGVAVAITPEDGDHARATETSSAVTKKLDGFGLQKLLGEACFWRRGLGGGAILIDADDGRPSDQPLDETRIRSIRALRYYSKRELQPASYYADSRHPKYGQPASYWLSPQDMVIGTALSTVHESRLAIVDGLRVSKTRRRMNQGWGGSLLVRCYEELRNYGLGWAATTQLMQMSSQAVYTMRGLIDGIADGETANIEERMRLVELYRSIARAVLLDAGDIEGKGAEKFELHSVDFGGLAPVVDLFCKTLSAVTGIPMTVLFGQSPAGQNATGDSDHEVMGALVETEQSQILKPVVEQIARVVMLAKDGPTRGLLPQQWEAHFPPLRVMSAEQQADLRKKVAEADKIYIEAGVVLPEEIATSRFRAEGWSDETTIDLEARKELLEAGRARPGEGGEPAGGTAPEGAPASAVAAPTDPNADVVPVEEAKDPTAALNGAQIQQMRETIVAVVKGEIPRQTGVEILASAFPFSREQAEQIMGDVGRSFEPKPQPAAVPFGGSPAGPAQETAQDTNEPEDADEDGAPGADAGEAPAGSKPKRPGARAKAPREDRRDSTSDVVRLDAGDEHTGAMVALFLDPATAARFALDGGTPPEDMHVTLAYLGHADAIHPVSLDALRALLRPIAAAASGPMQAWLSGVGTFAPTNGSDGAPVSYLSVDAPWLSRLRESVIAACKAAPMVAPSEQHGFTPHITLAYGAHVLDRVPFDAPVPVMFGSLVLCVGDRREHFTFGAGADAILTPEQMPVVTSVLAKVSSGALPRETGVELIEASTRMPRAQVEQLVGDIGRAVSPAPARRQGD